MPCELCGIGSKDLRRHTNGNLYCPDCLKPVNCSFCFGCIYQLRYSKRCGLCIRLGNGDVDYFEATLEFEIERREIVVSRSEVK